MSVYHGGDRWRSGAPEDYLDFSSNLNPDGAPDWVHRAMFLGLSRSGWYPDVRTEAARRGVSRYLGVDEDGVIVTAGGIEAVALAARLPARHVVVQPAFQEYGRLCGRWRSVRRESLWECSLMQDECLWLCNPNNPTGDALTRKQITVLLDRAAEAGARVVVDEAFIEYCPEHSVHDLAAERPELIVLGSMTKVLAIPGIRLGYLVAHPTVIGDLRKKLLPWRLNCAADAVAAALPGHQEDFERIRTLNAGRRERFAAQLRALGAEVFPSEANFLLCDFRRDMRPTISALKRKRVLLRPCGMFPELTHGHVRLCVRTDRENERLIRMLEEQLSFEIN